MERNRFNLLDPLRFVAALAVLLYHYAIYLQVLPPALLHGFSFGYLGVNFFFLLSGFVISASAEDRGALEFAISRAIRLYPAFWICLLLTVTIAYLFQDAKISILDILANATILNDYLGIKNIDGVYWTLQAELKFYACIFLLILTGLIRYIKIWLSVWILFSITHHFYDQPFFLGWFISPEYSFYFIGGVCCYNLYRNKRDRLLLIFLCISSIFSAIKATEQIHNFYPSATNLDEIIAAAVVTSFFILFYLLSLGYFNVVRRSYFLLLGVISYPLYLIHNRAGKILIEELSEAVAPIVSVTLISVLILGSSLLIHLLFEKKISASMKAFAQKLLVEPFFKRDR